MLLNIICWLKSIVNIPIGIFIIIYMFYIYICFTTTSHIYKRYQKRREMNSLFKKERR
jgi:hypothetical protein